jgi:hypothetical protein
MRQNNGPQCRTILREIKMSVFKLSTFLSHPFGPLITTLTSSWSPYSTIRRTLNFLLVVQVSKTPSAWCLVFEKITSNAPPADLFNNPTYDLLEAKC